VGVSSGIAAMVVVVAAPGGGGGSDGGGAGGRGEGWTDVELDQWLDGQGIRV